MGCKQPQGGRLRTAAQPLSQGKWQWKVEKETGCPGDCFAFFAFIDELSITKLYFRLLFLLSCGLFFSFQGYDIELQPGNGLKCPATAAAASSGSGSSGKKAKQLFQVVQLCARIKFLLQKSYKSACLISCRRRRLWKHIAVVASAEIGRIWRVKLKLCNFSLRLSSSSLLTGNVDSPSTWSNRKLLWDPDRFYCL